MSAVDSLSIESNRAQRGALCTDNRRGEFEPVPLKPIKTRKVIYSQRYLGCPIFFHTLKKVFESHQKCLIKIFHILNAKKQKDMGIKSSHRGFESAEESCKGN